ncbi:MAG: glutamyl-tRNA reductase [Chloroflexi bacterium]|nr:glutamyl-tRNA reductase [Chloroflexota bacterium]
MNIIAVGLNHRTAPVDVRDRVTVSTDRLEEALGALRDHTGNGVILSTCNRSEVYSQVASIQEGVDAILSFMRAYHGIDRQELTPYLYMYEQEEAVSHLFRVACSLDSMILGESQILGQVRRAFGAAGRHDMCNGSLSRLFNQALRVGKRARTDTSIGRNALSVSNAAVQLARRVFPEFSGRRVLVLGLGDAGKLAARALSNAGARNIMVVNRTYQRAVDTAAELGGTPVPFDRLADALDSADIIVASTGSPGYILTPEMPSLAARDTARPLFIIDIAVPRDVDPAVGHLPGLHLYDIDDLEAVSGTNRREREQEAAKVEAIVADEAPSFMHWLASRESVPTVAALRQRAETIRAKELARLVRRLPNLSDEQRAPLEAFSRALVNKLLHAPITTLKRNHHPAQTEVVRELFDLDGQQS